MHYRFNVKKNIEFKTRFDHILVNELFVQKMYLILFVIE